MLSTILAVANLTFAMGRGRRVGGRRRVYRLSCDPFKNSPTIRLVMILKRVLERALTSEILMNYCRVRLVNRRPSSYCGNQHGISRQQNPGF